MDETVSVPYWDYTIDAETSSWNSSILWTDDWFGQVGIVDGRGAQYDGGSHAIRGAGRFAGGEGRGGAGSGA